MIHSIDLHGIDGPSQALLGSILPGTNKTIEIRFVFLICFGIDLIKFLYIIILAIIFVNVNTSVLI
jgi:hypothetical protein